MMGALLLTGVTRANRFPVGGAGNGSSDMLQRILAIHERYRQYIGAWSSAQGELHISQKHRAEGQRNP